MKISCEYLSIYLRDLSEQDVIQEAVEKGIIIGKVITSDVRWIKLCKARGFKVFDPYRF